MACPPPGSPPGLGGSGGTSAGPLEVAGAAGFGRGETWLLLRSGAGTPAANMAADEALLQTVASLGHPVLRFYAWSEPAATFGYSQRYETVAQLTSLRPLLRRPTGGGMVPHDRDWTYSLVFPPCHEWYGLEARASYWRVHAWMRSAFARRGQRTELAGPREEGAPGACFARPVQSDLMSGGRKVAGAAQRHCRAGLLVQGSVQPAGLPGGSATPGSTAARAEWEAAVCAVAESDWGVRWQELRWEGVLAALAGELAQGKYSEAAYHRRR